MCLDGTCTRTVVIVAPGCAYECGGKFVRRVVIMIATLHLVCLRPSLVMREKSPVRSMLDWICGMSC